MRKKYIQYKHVRNYLPTFLCQFPSVIIDKVDTHSIQGFSRYCKNYFIDGYGSPCVIEDCYICKQWMVKTNPGNEWFIHLCAYLAFSSNICIYVYVP